MSDSLDPVSIGTADPGKEVAIMLTRTRQGRDSARVAVEAFGPRKRAACSD
jgi:hypothetical protein